MALSGLAWVRDKQRGVARSVAVILARFARERRSSTAVEFALVGTYYFIVLLFAIEGGIFYIKVDTLDLATERASRLIILNNVAMAPATNTAFINDIANDSYGVLQATNITVMVRMRAPIDSANLGTTGFRNLSTVFDPSVYTYVPGSCQETTVETTPPSVTSSGCTGLCTTSVLGQADSGYVTTNLTTGVSTLNQIYTCSAGQDILVEVKYKDTTLTSLVSAFFGPVISTLAFQAEPSIT